MANAERGNAGAEIGLVLKAFAVLGLDMDVRVIDTPALPLADGGEPWTPDVAEILNRARGGKP